MRAVLLFVVAFCLSTWLESWSHRWQGNTRKSGDVITVALDKSPMINTEGARAFADFVLAPETQQLVGQFGVARFGQPLFFPAAHLTDEQLGV